MTSQSLNIRSSDLADDLELIRLRRRFEKHLDDYRAHTSEYLLREEKLLHEQETTSRNIKELSELIKIQADATHGMVEVWNAANTIRRSIVWVTGFSGAIVFIAWFTDVIKIGG